MSLPWLRRSLIAALVAGCASPSGLPDDSFAEPLALERAMKSYYERHASEDYGFCSSPYIDGLTQVMVVENTPERLVVDVRYFYRDWFNNDHEGIGRECTGFSGRSFTLGKGAAGVEVLDMTGPRRS